MIEDCPAATQPVSADSGAASKPNSSLTVGEAYGHPTTRPLQCRRGPGVDRTSRTRRFRRPAPRAQPGPRTTEPLTEAGSSMEPSSGTGRISTLTLASPVTVRLGGAQDGAVIHLLPRHGDGADRPAQRHRPAGTPLAVHDLRELRVHDGPPADTGCWMILLISRQHAVLYSERRAAGLSARPAAAETAPSSMGHRISETAVTEADVIGVGPLAAATLRRSTCRLHRRRRQYLCRRAADRHHQQRQRTAASVTFTLASRTLLAVIGPSGAGKSTLLNALTGSRPADQGTVLYDDRDLYRDYAELRHRIGLVPQDDILHTAADRPPGPRLRGASCASRRTPPSAERKRRVDEVLAELEPVGARRTSPSPACPAASASASASRWSC